MTSREAKAIIEQIFDKYRKFKVVRVATNENTPEMNFLHLVESIVDQLEPDEKRVVQERYMKQKRITDMHVYTFQFDPPISAVTYTKIRKAAFDKLLYTFKKLELY
ncbi:hypothetical protein [Paenibacillus alvei]|uniref:Phage transcriptional regulator, ArpU family n=1 Tax=Paenibacillus alvei TaxID=44250 RepID=A0AAP7DJ64_PAEAL|nr:hypothetical protein [Paenibacillus alvei]NOJ72458.1 hypothetical protein [Paenibacillus alvei]